MPSAAEYALAVEKEHRWLPEFAPGLPLPASTPVAKGEPGEGHPFPWSIYSWLDGEPASHDRIVEPVRFAVDLAEFLSALRQVDPATARVRERTTGTGAEPCGPTPTRCERRLRNWPGMSM